MAELVIMWVLKKKKRRGTISLSRGSCKKSERERDRQKEKTDKQTTDIWIVSKSEWEAEIIPFLI